MGQARRLLRDADGRHAVVDPERPGGKRVHLRALDAAPDGRERRAPRLGERAPHRDVALGQARAQEAAGVDRAVLDRVAGDEDPAVAFRTFGDEVVVHGQVADGAAPAGRRSRRSSPSPRRRARAPRGMRRPRRPCRAEFDGAGRCSAGGVTLTTSPSPRPNLDASSFKTRADGARDVDVDALALEHALLAQRERTLAPTCSKMKAYSTAIRPPPWMKMCSGTRPMPTMESESKIQPVAFASSKGSDGSRVDPGPSRRRGRPGVHDNTGAAPSRSASPGIAPTLRRRGAGLDDDRQRELRPAGGESALDGRVLEEVRRHRERSSPPSRRGRPWRARPLARHDAGVAVRTPVGSVEKHRGTWRARRWPPAALLAWVDFSRHWLIDWSAASRGSTATFRPMRPPSLAISARLAPPMTSESTKRRRKTSAARARVANCRRRVQC